MGTTIRVGAPDLQPGQYVQRLRAFIERQEWSYGSAADFFGYVERVERHDGVGPTIAVTFVHGRTVWAMEHAPADVFEPDDADTQPDVGQYLVVIGDVENPLHPREDADISIVGPFTRDGAEEFAVHTDRYNVHVVSLTPIDADERTLANLQMRDGAGLMDPNEALRLVREAIGEIENDVGDAFDEHSQVGQLVTAFDALDGWLKRGGFLPSDWSNAKRRSDTHEKED